MNKQWNFSLKVDMLDKKEQQKSLCQACDKLESFAKVHQAMLAKAERKGLRWGDPKGDRNLVPGVREAQTESVKRFSLVALR